MVFDGLSPQNDNVLVCANVLLMASRLAVPAAHRNLSTIHDVKGIDDRVALTATRPRSTDRYCELRGIPPQLWMRVATRSTPLPSVRDANRAISPLSLIVPPLTNKVRLAIVPMPGITALSLNKRALRLSESPSLETPATKFCLHPAAN